MTREQFNQTATVSNSEFYSVIVIKPDVFESQIVDERHFSTYKEAKSFRFRTILEHEDLICVMYEFKEGNIRIK